MKVNPENQFEEKKDGGVKMNKNKIVLGWVLIALGVLAIFTAGLLTYLIDNQAIRILSPISCAIFGGCLVTGSGLIHRGKSDKADKEYEIEQHDERNIAIRGKASYIAFFLMLFLTLAFSAYLFYFKDDMITGFIGYGIVVVSLLTFLILYQIFKKKM